MPERREELLKLKFDMVYRGMKRDVAEPKFQQIVSVSTQEPQERRTTE